jgi:hypothetical protein
MSPVMLRSVEELGRFGRLCWLPAGGRGNGLGDGAWTPVLQISEAAVAQVLAALAAAMVPAFAAPAHPARPRSPVLAREPATCQLWVGTSAYGRAEAVLLAIMPHRGSRRCAGPQTCPRAGCSPPAAL